MRKPSVLVVFLTVFIDLIGFGIVLPLLPLYNRDLGAPGWLIGVIQASFSAMQFLFAPAWGRLSDRIGRRPVLLVSTAGAAVSYAIFSVGAGLSGQTGFVVVVVFPVVGGNFGGHIPVPPAGFGDITPPPAPSRKVGL